MIMIDKSFHLRANEVRAESQALMLKLRAERLAASRHRTKSVSAKKQGAKVATPVTKPKPPVTSILASRKIQSAVKPLTVTDPVVPIVSQRTAEIPRPEHAEAKAVQPTAARKVKKAETAPVVEVSVPSTVAVPPVSTGQPKSNIQTRKSHKLAEPKKAVKHKQADRPLGEITADAVPTLVEPAAGADASPPDVQLQKPVRTRSIEPLTAIPALGPGMIWRLSQVGVQTLGDLAVIEADDLRTRLGAVAKLVRVENWIDQARLKTG
jgi:predicted flap endonuclease-1-like 5' DNA nuclease